MNKLIKNRLEKTLKRIWFNLSCYASTNQVAQSPIQCDLEQFLGCAPTVWDHMDLN